jgi:Na+/melibiose symporter-like transporter
MLFANLWDAINDPLMGVIADHTHSRWGRYRPYFLFAPVIFAVVSVLAFINPQFSQAGKIAWTAVFFIGYGMLCTVLVMPTYAIVPAHTKNLDDRNKIFAWGAIGTAASFTIASSFTLNIQKAFGSWAPLIAIYGLLTVINYFWLFKESKERYLIKVEKRSVLKDLKTVFRHWELYPILLIWICCSVGYGLMFSTSVYYILYYTIRPDLISTYMLTLSMGALVSMMFLMPALLKVLKHAHLVMIWTLVPTIVLYIILYFTGNINIVLLYVLSGLATFLSSMQCQLVNLLMTDLIDLIQLKDKVSLNGTISSMRGFAFKCGTTIQSAGILAILAATGYVAGAVGHQPPSAMFAFNFMRFLLPSILAAVVVVLCIFYPVKKHFADIEKMKEAMKANEGAD